MDLFRRKQKLVFWIVTIIIVPSFVLVWGAGDFFSRDQNVQEFEIGKVDGKTINYQEFDKFRRRINSAIGGIPLQFAGAPGQGSQIEELWKYLLTYTVLQDAEKSGAVASDLQIGTYLQNGHPTLTMAYNPDDPQSLERAVDQLCRQMQLTRQEFLQGVREWATIGNYVIADANLAAVNDDTVYTFYSFSQAQCQIKRIRITPTQAINEQAQREVMDLPTEELEQRVRDYAAAKADDSRYRTPSAWRFAYLFEPLVPETSVRQPSDEEIQQQYDLMKTQRYNDLPLEDVRERIVGELLEAEVERQTLRNFTVDIDPQLRTQGALPLDELTKLTQLAKYGVTAGTTGDELLEIPALTDQLPSGSALELRVILEALDEEEGPVRDTFMAEWKEGFNLGLRPFKADDGYYRLRLLEYRPSAPAEVDDEEGKVKPEIFELAVADMVGDRVDELVEEQALEMEQRIRQYMEDKEAGREVDQDLENQLAALPVETINYQEIADIQYEIGRLVVGDIWGPMPTADASVKGQDIVLLVDRMVPSRADFEAESPEIKARFRQMAMASFRGNYGFSYTFTGPTAVIQPSPVIMGSLVDRLNRQAISINPEIVQNAQNEG